MDDPFDFIAAEAGKISSSQEERLRSSASSASHRLPPQLPPPAMGKKTPRPPSSSSSSPERHGGCDGEVDRPGDGQLHAGGAVGVEDLADQCNGVDNRSGRSEETHIRVSKRKGTPEEEADVIGSLVDLRKSKRLCAFSDESTQEPDHGLKLSESRKEPLKPAQNVESQIDHSHLEADGEIVANGESSKTRDVDHSDFPLLHPGEEVLDDSHGGASANPAPGDAALKVTLDLPAVAQNQMDRQDFIGAAVGNPKLSEKGAIGLRKLPPSFQVPVDEEGNDRADPSVSAPVKGLKPLENQQALGHGQSEQSSFLPSRNSLEEGPMAKMLPSESELIDLLLKFSKKPDRRLENVDFLEVLAMKGIHIPPPRWWRPGGYGPP
ncbi:unnamed protein product [Spirodela intermedia]|uniref:Uncharacterized protein n=1 Tax=Spirodela intermedia TaxID=51605 RepID=A0A7I8JI02_SPIIN|nr:unnamed protein product [Spirodela intermedia]CAA6669784.1 unnamed protein product [Spirodela intermedia]